MVLEGGARNLFPVVQVFRADETHDRIDQQGLKGSCDRVGARLEGLLIDAVMRAGRQRRALSCLKVHDISADGVPGEGQASILTFTKQGQVDAKAAVRRFSSRYRLKDKIHR